MKPPKFAAPALLGILLVSGCATLQQITALRQVDFSLHRVSELRVAGVELDRVRSFSELGVVDVSRLAVALANRDVPLELALHVFAENPPDNPVSARLLQMDWTLLLQDRETISGSLARSFELQPGVPTDVPVDVRLNLVEFFEGSSQDLIEVALSLAGQGGASKEIKLQALPTIDTALGPIRYPQPITIVSRTVGGERD
jgi:hypothetical protein